MKHEPVDLAAGRLGAVWADGPDAGSRRSDSYSFSRLGITRRPQSPDPDVEPDESPTPAAVPRTEPAPAPAERERAAPQAQDIASTPRRREWSPMDLLRSLTGKFNALGRTKRLFLAGGAVLAGSLLLTLLFWPSGQPDQPARATPAQVAQRPQAKPPAPAKVDPVEPPQEVRGELSKSLPAVALRPAETVEPAEPPQSVPVPSLAPMGKALWAWLADLVPERWPARPLATTTAPADPTRATDGAREASSIAASVEAVQPPVPAAADLESSTLPEVDVPVSPDSKEWLPMPKIHLTGTMHGLGPQPIAMISGRLIKQGQYYKGALIVRVGKGWVEVKFQGRKRRIGVAASIGPDTSAQDQ